MRILAFDQSVTASAAVVLESVDSNRITPVAYLACKPKNTGIYRYLELKAWIEKVIKEKGCDLIAREMHHQMQHGAASQIQVVGGFIDIAAASHLPGDWYTIIPVTVWKKFLTGKGNLAKDTAYLMTLYKSLRSTPMFVPPATLEQTDDNIADALCIGITAYAAKRARDGNFDGITKDQAAVLKKNLDLMFDYGKK